MSEEFQRIDTLIEEHMGKFEIPGISIAIIKKNEVVYARGYGRESLLEDSNEVTQDTLFRAMSVSKPLIGTLIMRLVTQGVLDLDVPIRHYIPWFELRKPGVAEKITLRLLLSHRCGLPGKGEPDKWGDPEALEQYMHEYVPTLELMAEPDTGSNYSRHALNIACYVAEVATGKKFEQLMQEFILKPLGMERTTFDWQVAMKYPIAAPHYRYLDGTWEIADDYFQNCDERTFSTSCMTNARDLAKFAMMHLKGGLSLLSPQTIALMQTLQSPCYRLSDFSYGLSWCRLQKRNKMIIHHYGHEFNMVYSSALMLCPDDQIGLALLGNGEAVDRLARKIFDLLLFGELLPSLKPEENPEVENRTLWPLYTGTFFSYDHGFLEVKIENDQLYLQMHGEKMKLTPYKKQVYYTYDAEGKLHIVGFPVEGNTPVGGIEVENNLRGRIELSEYKPNHLDWGEWVGSYTGELGTFSVSVRDNRLVVWDALYEEEHLYEALAPDLFVSKTEGTIKFRYFNSDSPTMVFRGQWRAHKVNEGDIDLLGEEEVTVS